MKLKDIYFEIKYYPHRAWKYKTLWLWSERMLKIRRADKHKRHRIKGYASLKGKSRYCLEKLGVKNCKLCGTENNLTIDHIKPVSKGGKNNLENLQILCKLCNQVKADKF